MVASLAKEGPCTQIMISPRSSVSGTMGPRVMVIRMILSLYRQFSIMFVPTFPLSPSRNLRRFS